MGQQELESSRVIVARQAAERCSLETEFVAKKNKTEKEEIKLTVANIIQAKEIEGKAKKTEVEKMTSRLSEISLNNDDLRSEVNKLQQELESSRVIVARQAAERCSLEAEFVAKKDKTDKELIKLTAANIIQAKEIEGKAKELAKIKKQVQELDEVRSSKSLEILHLNNDIQQLRQKESFVSEALAGLCSLEKSVHNSKLVVNQTFDHLIDKVVRINEYMANGLNIFEDDH